jgi:hypothetical protein
MTYFIISDIAGFFNPFLELLKKAPKGSTVVILGDVNDKGPESSKIIEYLIQHPEIIWLMGNHEHMFYKVYENITQGVQIKYKPLFWIFSNGGYFTLKSYGMNIPLPKLNNSEVSYRTIKKEFRKRSEIDVFKDLMEDSNTQLILDFIKTIPKSHIDHIKKLPLKFETDSLFCSHAPVKETEKYERYFDLNYIDSNYHYEQYGALWNRNLPKRERKDKKFIVYGHMNVDSIYCHTKKHPIGIKTESVLSDSFAVCFDTCSRLYKISALEYPSMIIHQEETHEDKE